MKFKQDARARARAQNFHKVTTGENTADETAPAKYFSPGKKFIAENNRVYARARTRALMFFFFVLFSVRKYPGFYYGR